MGRRAQEARLEAFARGLQRARQIVAVRQAQRRNQVKPGGFELRLRMTAP